MTFKILKFQKYPTMMIFLFCARDIFARDIEKMPVTILRKMPVTNLKNRMSRAYKKCHGKKNAGSEVGVSKGMCEENFSTTSHEQKEKKKECTNSYNGAIPNFVTLHLVSCFILFIYFDYFLVFQ